MKVSMKPQRIDLSRIEVDQTRNVREDVAYSSQRLRALEEDLALRGQQDAVVLELIGDKYFPIKGFRRCAALQNLQTRGVTDPTTVKTNEAGEPIPSSGTIFNAVNAIVYQNLSDRERIELLLDHGQREGLNKVELQMAAERSFSVAHTEKDTVVILYGLLAQLYPPTRKIEETDEAKLAYYRGIVQTAKLRWLAPTVLHEACMSQLRGDQKWPTLSTLRELVKIHTDACARPNGIAYNRQNPGPEFKEAWSKLMVKVAEAVATGEARPKDTSMMNRQQVDESIKGCDSLILKIDRKIVLNELPRDRFTLLNKMMVEIEKTLSEEVRQAIISLADIEPAVVPIIPV